jgi:hypothetical protein
LDLMFKYFLDRADEEIVSRLIAPDVVGAKTA